MIFIFSQSYLASSYGAFYANLFLCIFLLMGLILTGNIIEKSFLQKFLYMIDFSQKKCWSKKIINETKFASQTMIQK